MRWRCRSCGGTYDDAGPDGMLYFHACPPRHRPEGTLEPRPGHRDENPVPGLRRVMGEATPEHPTGETIYVGGVRVSTAPITSEGAGREPA